MTSKCLIRCYGMTKYDNQYAMVLDYAPEGSLKNYLKSKGSNLKLTNKIKILNDVCNALCAIHQKNLPHGDLHSGNIVIKKNVCRITDVGLCGPVSYHDINKPRGIIPYLAPELFQRGVTKTKESDIYSVGILMWEIFAEGEQPFTNRPHDYKLINDICKLDMRPPLIVGMPSDYKDIMEQCWSRDPSQRPNVQSLLSFAQNKFSQISNRDNGDSGNNNSNNNSSNNSSSSNSDNKYKSRLLDMEINLYEEGLK